MTTDDHVQLITASLIKKVLEGARSSARGRMTHSFHVGPQDNQQRFLNILTEGTYVTPHRHLNPPKPEPLLVLEGYVAVFTFEDYGRVRKGYLIGSGEMPTQLPRLIDRTTTARGIDLPPGIWHTVATLTSYAVCYEVKPGPYEPASDREFAPWAPSEGDEEAARYLADLLM
jgi:cupin fold WbuC family metalloprotein